MAIRTGVLESVEVDDMDAMYRLEFTPVSLCADRRLPDGVGGSAPPVEIT
ncbi:hypothetical protein ACFVTE_02550 [Arthrobacter sp. NPDC058097]